MRPSVLILVLILLLGSQQRAQGLALGTLLGGDAAAGMVAAATVAPWVASVDRAITLNAAGRQSLGSAFVEDISDTFQSPFTIFSKQTVQWLWFVYAVTYLAANMTDSVAREVVHVSPALPVLWASTTANTLACVAKDAAFAQMYGGNEKKQKTSSSLKSNRQSASDSLSSNKEEPRPVPKLSYAVWLLRDILTAFSAFTLPPLLQEKWQVPSLLSRFAGPVVAQYFTTPLHLTGLALHNQNNDDNDRNSKDNNTNWMERIFDAVKETYPETIVARQLRIIPAFSVGGVLNSQLRDLLASHHDWISHIST